MWLYWIVFLIGVAIPIYAGIYFVHVANSPYSGSIAAMGIYFAQLSFVALCVLAFVLLAVRFLIPEAFDHIFNFLLLRHS